MVQLWTRCFRHIGVVLALLLSLATAARAQVASAYIRNPVPGSTLSGSTTMFSWNGYGVSEYWLYVGSSQGIGDLFNSNSLGTATSCTAPSLPSDGRYLFVRLWYRAGSYWQYTDYHYVASSNAQATTASITNPMPGSTLSGSVAMFYWTGTGVAQYWLYLGTSPGNPDLYNSGSLALNTYCTVGNLPTDGRDIHVCLWYQSFAGIWQARDYLYKAASPTRLIIGSDQWLNSPIPFSLIGTKGSYYGQCVPFVRASRPDLGLDKVPQTSVVWAADLANKVRTLFTVNGFPRQGAVVVAPSSGYLVTGSHTGRSGHVGIVRQVLSGSGDVYQLVIRDADAHNNYTVDEREFTYRYSTRTLVQKTNPKLGMTGGAPSTDIEFVHERQ